MIKQNNIKIEILKDLGEFKAGSYVTLLADIKGTPFDRYWRQRLADAKEDGCCRVVPATGLTPKTIEDKAKNPSRSKARSTTKRKTK